MRRGIPSIGGAKPPLSFQNIIHPLPVIEEDSASHDEDTPRVPERSPMRISPLASAAGPTSTPRVTTPPPPLRSRSVLPLQKTTHDGGGGSGGRPTRTLLPIQRTTGGHGSGGGDDGPVAQQSEKADHSVKGWLAKRGGWYRAALMAALAVCTIVALTVGLVLGLRQRNNPSATPSDQEGEQPVLFPAGSYSFTTALYDVKTDCTSNNDTFRCYPNKIYNQSRPDSPESESTYFWTISQVNSWAYTITAAPNPFVPQFTNLSLTQLEANQPGERLTFTFQMHGAAVVPLATLGGGGNDTRSATCYYNDTVVTGTIWTRRPAAFPANLTTSVSNGGGKGRPLTASTTFDPWPYAVQVVQSTRDAPNCQDIDGNRVGGNFGRAGECSCSYANFDL
ncbi:hypothetical protein PG991_011581 [Apiospora marii]|uniref:Tat pathway signal sequence n=1 Tax=Apiospora marii TaxID=335849 RepID=A0ABR1REU7_9PEZI